MINTKFRKVVTSEKEAEKWNKEEHIDNGNYY